MKRMSGNLKDQISSEIKRVRVGLEEQKRLIKVSIDKPLTMETAVQEMKALHTRLALLEANLAKEIDQIS